MAPRLSILSLSLILSATTMLFSVQGANPVQGTTSWCVARSDASYQALQTALDYACSAGADCTPLQSNGLCYLPNTIQAHASYAFNSYYQRKAMAPGSCDFSGTATVAKTDPSYGSCVYPSSQSTAGGTTPTTPQPTTSGTNLPTTQPLVGTPVIGGNVGNPNPEIETPTTVNSKASLGSLVSITIFTSLVLVAFSFNLEPILIF